jgi:hypothetical protein
VVDSLLLLLDLKLALLPLVPGTPADIDKRAEGGATPTFIKSSASKLAAIEILVSL